MPDLMDEFVTECRSLRRQHDWPERIANALQALIATEGFAALLSSKMDPAFNRQHAKFLQSSELTIFANLSHGGLRGPPHDHRTVAVVGLVSGVEQFMTYSSEGDRIREGGLRRVVAPQVEVLPEDVVHALWNNGDEGGLSLHVYGSSFVDDAKRRLWDPYSFAVQPYDESQNFQWTKELTLAARGAD